MSVVLFDLKNRYGAMCHAFADLVLIEFANLLMLQPQKTEIVVHYGGEKFILLLPGTDLQGCESVAEIIRKSAVVKRYSDGTTEL